MTAAADLRALADRPFELLAALEARLAGDEAGADRSGEAEWAGLAFELGDRRYLAPRDDVRELLEPPAVTRVPGAKPWLVGLANVRGDLLPIVDLGRFLGVETGRHTEASRVIVLDDERIAAGFLVDGVGGFRGFAPRDQRHELVDDADAAPDDDDPAACVLGAFVRDGAVWRVLSLRKLAGMPAFRDAGA